jgi:hypothetical protein
MWVFTTDGFFSTVRSREFTDRVVVRSRKRDHLERLCTFLGWDADHFILETPDADYRWRMTVLKHIWSWYLAVYVARHLKYTNFKDAAEKVEADGRYSSALHDVWTTMNKLQEDRKSCTDER